MSLELRKSSNWWYGVFMVNGTRTIVNLGVPITGARPPKRTMLGDDEFERSRGRALEAYEIQRKKLVEDRTGEKTLQKLAEIKTGREVTFPKLADLPQLWSQIPRRKVPNVTYAGQCQIKLARFVTFVAAHQPGATEFLQVKPETARAFMASEAERGLSAKTWNDTLKLLRATFKHLHPSLTEGSNPFHGLVTKTAETVNREPFTVEELKAILEVCAEDDFIRPIIITGMCTAMRRGDCCLLKWQDVDLKEGFLTVKTAKTGETVDIPIFPKLREELEKLGAKKGKSEFCFPEAAAMYKSNRDGITWRVKQVLARAMESMNRHSERGQLSPLSTGEARTRGWAFLDGQEPSPKTTRMRQVFEAYINGKGISEVMAATGCSRGTVSGYLNEIERAIGGSFIRGNSRKADTEALQVERAHGKRKASIRDFHSFRVTWITLALAAGVPLELVQRVTGHRTVAVVMKHYFRPGREDFRQALNTAMPQFLVEEQQITGARSPKEEIRRIIDRITPRTWKQDKARILQLLEAI
jgi:integrase